MGPRTVRGLAFEGNRAIDDLTLRISIATSVSSWWARTGLVSWVGLGERKYFDEREFRRDVLRLRLLYNQSGYLDAQIDTLVRRDDENVYVRFLIYEGEPVRVTSLELEGLDGVVDRRQITRRIPLRVGEPFNRFLLQASADSIRSIFMNRGHPFAEVYRSFDLDAESRTATVGFDVDPGPRAVVGDVVVTGTRDIDERVVRRLSGLRTGALYRQDDLFRAQQDLYRTDLFTYVVVGLEDSLPALTADSQVNLRVHVTEGQLYRMRFGAGYGTIDCFRGLAGWTARDFFGGGRSLDLAVRTSKIGTGSPVELGLERNLCRVLNAETDSARLQLNYAVSATFREPYFFSRNTSASVALTAERRSEFQAYLREAVGGEVAVVQRAPWDTRVTGSYTLAYGRTVAEPAIFCVFLAVCRVEDIEPFRARRVQSMLGLAVLRDRTDSPLDPLRGSVVAMDLRWASPIIGSDSLMQFARAVGEFSSYHPLGRRTVFAWRVRAGAIVSPGFLAADTLGFIPPDEKFYTGGPNTVRGFGQNQLGPIVRVVVPRATPPADTLTAPTGGNRLLVMNAELRFPLPVFGGRLGGALFVDGGQVHEQARGIGNLADFRVTPGFGFRFASPLGPIRMDVAWNHYAPKSGALYCRGRLDDEGDCWQGVNGEFANELTLVEESFAPARPEGLFSRLRFHFSVGQAF